MSLVVGVAPLLAFEKFEMPRTPVTHSIAERAVVALSALLWVAGVPEIKKGGTTFRWPLGEGTFDTKVAKLSDAKNALPARRAGTDDRAEGRAPNFYTDAAQKPGSRPAGLGEKSAILMATFSARTTGLLIFGGWSPSGNKWAGRRGYSQSWRP